MICGLFFISGIDVVFPELKSLVGFDPTLLGYRQQ